MFLAWQRGSIHPWVHQRWIAPYKLSATDASDSLRLWCSCSEAMTTLETEILPCRDICENRSAAGLTHHDEHQQSEDLVLPVQHSVEGGAPLRKHLCVRGATSAERPA